MKITIFLITAASLFLFVSNLNAADIPPDDFWILHRQCKAIARHIPEVLPKNNPELMRHNLAQIEELYSNDGAVDYLCIDGHPAGIPDLAWKLQPDTLVTRSAMQTLSNAFPTKP